MLRQNSFGRKIARSLVMRSPIPWNSNIYRMSTVTKKSWVPIQEDLLQKVTTNSLIHEMSMQATESAAIVVPWFLSSMPVRTANSISYSAQNFTLLESSA